MRLDFLFTSLLVVVSPGSGVLLTVSVGLSRGLRGAVVTAFGCTLGIVPHVLVAVTGLAALLRASGPAFDLVRFAGVGYLLHLAWSTWRQGGALAVPASVDTASDWKAIRRAMFVNLLNPKLSMFFVAFLPQFVEQGSADATLSMLRLSAVFMAMTLGVFVLYGAFAARARERILTQPRVQSWMRRGFAAAFVGLGVKLALAER